VKWGPLGPGTLDSSLFIFSAAGVPAAVELIFSDQPGNGPDISSYRAIEFRRVDAGAVTADITVSFRGGQNRPKGIVALNSASTGRFRFPATGALRMDVECCTEEFLPSVRAAPDMKENTDLTLTGISDAAQTIAAYVYY